MADRTLYLSRIQLKARHARTGRELREPYELHRTLSKGFSDLIAARVLFRAEIDTPGRPIVLVQSLVEPNWSYLLETGHVLDVDYKTLTLEGIRNGQPLRFRLLCRPSKRAMTPVVPQGRTREKGKRINLLKPDEAFDWLRRQGSRHGFEVRDAAFDRHYWYDTNYAPREESAESEEESKPAPKLGAIRFDGTMIVSDPDKLRNVIALGIGQQKAYGFGLLSVA